MRILLLGATGQLGRSFIEHGGLATRGALSLTSRSGRSFDDSAIELADLADPATLLPLLDRLRPELIVNTAAYTAVDRAEQEEALATRINAEAVAVLGAWAQRHDALVVHYSTDYVFDGESTQAYPVDALTGPLGAYGRSKLAGEIALRESGADHLIFRTAWVYAPHGQNFLRTMLRLGAERDVLRVVADQHGAPTSTALIVEGTLAALDHLSAGEPAQRQRLLGTHHLVAGGTSSWHAFAEAIFEQGIAQGLITSKPQIIPIGTKDFPTPARRPAWSVLDNSGFQKHFECSLPQWQASLHDVIAQLTRRSHGE
jgi:dTDP-4-dehydrorhamnose reductase